MPLLEGGAGHPPNARMAAAACAAHRLEVLRERQLRARFGCPLLALDDGAAVEDGHETACACSPHNTALGLAGEAVLNWMRNFQQKSDTVSCWCARSMAPLMEDIQGEMSALAEPLVRAAIGAVSKTLRASSAGETAVAGPRQAGVEVALWHLVCRTVSVWADSVDHTQLRGFLQVSMTAACSKGCLYLWDTPPRL